MTLATDGLLGGRWTVDGGLEMLPAEGSLASRHDPLPALRPLMLLSAMRPTEGDITSCLSQQCVPETLFKDCIYDDIIDSRVSNLRVSSCVGGC